jgi:HupE / UreJ protein
MNCARRVGWLALLAPLAFADVAQAHVASNGFLSAETRGSTLEGSLELAVRDVELAVGVDANGDGRVTWGELRASGRRLTQYVQEHLSVQSATKTCELRFGSLQINPHVDGNYVWLPFAGNCPGTIDDLTITYRVLQGVDPSHRLLVKLSHGTIVQTAVLDSHPAAFDVRTVARWRTVAQYFQAGMWHIWSGIDHLLFLLSLLLPAVLLRSHGKWLPVNSARPAFMNILRVVTAFTVAHSITLSLAAFNVVHLPSRLTESVIAASIVVAALNNIFSWVTHSRERIAFAFGLLHGFGFASVLADMGLPANARLLSLVSFNLGIEAGQLAVVAAVMPIAFLVRTRASYRYAVLPWGSAAIALLACVWFVERAFGAA